LLAAGWMEWKKFKNNNTAVTPATAK